MKKQKPSHNLKIHVKVKKHGEEKMRKVENNEVKAVPIPQELMQSDYEFLLIPRKVLCGDRNGWLQIVQPSMLATLTTSFQPYSAEAKTK